MFNPFARFIPELVDAFLKHDEHLLVSQTFRPGVEVVAEQQPVALEEVGEEDLALCRRQWWSWSRAAVRV